MTEVYNFLDSLCIEKKDNLVVAVSYGPDSMFLLDVLKNKYNDNKIICAHVHHNHRKESDDEEKKLRSYCKEHDITFEFMKIDEYTNGKFTEEEARHKRYVFFDEIMNKYSSKYLFTAHHGDDLIETILMKITRGSTLKGYSGINFISNRLAYKIVRPLLYLTKDYILNYCKENDIPFAFDKSNGDDKYTRNRFRSNVLPFLKKEDKNVHRKFIDFSKTLNEYDNYINKVVLKKYEKIVNKNEINLKMLLKEDELIIKKIIELYLFNIYGSNIKNVDSKHVNSILKLLNNPKSNVQLSMPNKINIIKSYNKIYFDKKAMYNSYCYVFDGLVKLPNNGVIKQVDRLENISNYVTAFDSSELTLPMSVRNRLSGDRIEVLGLNGSKKIKDIFMDEKLDLKDRNNFPVLVDANGKILWLPGLKKSKYDKSKNGKYDIILKYYKEECNDAE